MREMWGNNCTLYHCTRLSSHVFVALIVYLLAQSSQLPVDQQKPVYFA